MGRELSDFRAFALGARPSMKNTTNGSRAFHKDERALTLRTKVDEQTPNKLDARSKGSRMPPRVLSLKATKVTAKILHHLEPGFSGTRKTNIEPVAQLIKFFELVRSQEKT